MVARPGDLTLNMNFGEVAGVTGLEPATSGVTGQRSNQLSYIPIKKTYNLFKGQIFLNQVTKKKYNFAFI